MNGMRSDHSCRIRLFTQSVTVTIVPLGKAFNFHIATSFSHVAIDFMRNEVSRVINIMLQELVSQSSHNKFA